MSWLIPDEPNSDHPGNASDTGPSWVASIVNAIGESKYWDSTAIVVVWDDWGGFYDNVLPPLSDHWGGLGFRVPALFVSAYARTGASGDGYVSHTQYEFGSILRFIEDTFDLGRLGTTDTRAKSIAEYLRFQGAAALIFTDHVEVLARVFRTPATLGLARRYAIIKTGLDSNL